MCRVELRIRKGERRDVEEGNGRDGVLVAAVDAVERQRRQVRRWRDWSRRSFQPLSGRRVGTEEAISVQD